MARVKGMKEGDVRDRLYGWAYEEKEPENVRDLVCYLKRWEMAGSIKFEKPKRKIELARAMYSLGAKLRSK